MIETDYCLKVFSQICFNTCRSRLSAFLDTQKMNNMATSVCPKRKSERVMSATELSRISISHRCLNPQWDYISTHPNSSHQPPTGFHFIDHLVDVHTHQRDLMLVCERPELLERANHARELEPLLRFSDHQRGLAFRCSDQDMRLFPYEVPRADELDWTGHSNCHKEIENHVGCDSCISSSCFRRCCYLQKHQLFI